MSAVKKRRASKRKHPDVIRMERIIEGAIMVVDAYRDLQTRDRRGYVRSIWARQAMDDAVNFLEISLVTDFGKVKGGVE